MSIASVFGDVVAFIGKYGNEANATADALEAIIQNLPINKSDAAKVLAGVETLRNAGENIAAALPKLTEQGAVSVTINESDIEKAVAAQLPALLNTAVADAVAKALAASSVVNEPENDLVAEALASKAVAEALESKASA